MESKYGYFVESTEICIGMDVKSLWDSDSFLFSDEDVNLE